MDRRRLMNVINFIVIIVCLIVDIILGIVFNFDHRFFVSTALFVGGIGVFNLIFIAIKEASILSYDSNKYDYILNALLSFLGVLAYYVNKYVNSFEKYGYLYWIIFINLLVITILICLFLRKTKKVNDNPKFIVNK